MRSALLLFLLTPAFAQNLLLTNAHVIDPKNHIDAVADVAITAGKVSAVGPHLPHIANTIDLTGLYLTPGLVDIHTHLFTTTNVHDAWAGDQSVMPDSFSFRTGVTTMVDAGSAGWRNFEDFRVTVIDRVKTRVFAFINISGLGMMTNAAEQQTSEFNPKEVARLALKHRDVVVGVKTAHYEAPDWTAVDRAVEAGTLAGIPVMVDFGFFRAERPYWQLVTQKLRPGDISTHVFRATVPFVDQNGKLYAYLAQARARGVRFDVGHGGGSFVFRNAVPAIQQGFYPDSISSDLHGGSMNAGMQDMPALISKMLACGLPLNEAILESTWTPAQMIHHPELGHLTVGATADIAIWSIAEGSFGFADSSNGRLTGSRHLVSEMTLHDGEIMWDRNARSAVDYKTLGPTYGNRPGVDVIVAPPK